MTYLSLKSPIGPLTLFEENGAIIVLEFGQAQDPDGNPDGTPAPVLERARDQLFDYFDGKRMDFDLPLQPQGTAHQQRVWQAMLAIPYGETRTYADLARDLGSGPRAVGSASARNPIPLLIPCHRVVGSDGNLRGYSGGEGIETKAVLLRLEGARI